jgi:alkylation response protein AidB-like acyl-CoA dehydrogenase
MQFAFTEEQDQFRDIVARFCRDKAPAAVVRKFIESGQEFDPGLWRQLCQEVGLVGIHLPEDRGGAGFSAIELGIVLEEFGRSLMPGPYFSCAVLACTAMAEVSDAAIRDSLIGSMVQGEKTGTLLLDPAHGDPVAPIECTGAGTEYTLGGDCAAALDAHNADFLLAIVRDGEETGLFLVETSSPGVSTELLNTMDVTRKQARVSLVDAAARKLCDLAPQQVQRIYDTALVALANEMVGGAEALLDSTVEYTKLRFQFGRAIGSFQALKHRLADLLVDVELARTAAWQAAAALASNEDASATASLAKSMAGDVYMKAALECIQMHGGIGFTWENDTHFWFRRAKTSEVFLGTSAFHRERMLQEMQL